MAGIAVNNTMVAFRIWAAEMLKAAERNRISGVSSRRPAARRPGRRPRLAMGTPVRVRISAVPRCFPQCSQRIPSRRPGG